MAKTFWKRYEFFVVAIITLAAIYLIAIFSQNIGFFLGNDLIVNLIPQQKSLDMNYGNSSTIYFDASIDNVFYCRAACSYSFNDRSRNEIIDRGDFEIKNLQHFSKSYKISVERLGSGQDIYSFDLACSSVRSFFCLTKSPQRLKSSLVTASYDLTEAEKELKRLLKQNVTQLLEALAEEEGMRERLSQKYFELGRKIRLNNLSRQKIEIDDASDKLRISIENLRSIWSIEDYFRLNRMFNESFLKKTGDIKNSIMALDGEIDGIADIHNGLLLQLDSLYKDLWGLANFAAALDSKESNKSFSDLNISIKNFNNLSSLVANNTFESYAQVAKAVENLSRHEESLIEKTMPLAESLFLKSEILLMRENDYLCGIRQGCNNNISIGEIAKNAQGFIESYPDAESLKQNCGLILGLWQKYAKIRNDTLSIILQDNISYPQGNDFIALADNFSSNEIININNSYYSSLQEIKAENKTDAGIVNALASLLPSNKTETLALDYRGL